MAKSSMDLKRRANSPEAQAALEIFKRNYGANPMQGGYNRVLEFDLLILFFYVFLYPVRSSRPDPGRRAYTFLTVPHSQ